MKHEHLRILEETQFNREVKAQIEAKIADIDELVYNDTIEQHSEKNKLDNQIEEIDKDIEELERLLARKKKERDMLVLEKEVHERRIQQARMKYADRLNAIEEEMQEVNGQLKLLEEQQLANQSDKQRLDSEADELH